MGGGGKRRLRPEDAALWEKVARTMERRLPGRPAPEDFRRMTKEPPPGERREEGPPGACAPEPGKSPRRSAPQTPPPLSPPPAPGGLDRRLRRRMVRGDVEIEARLDLHGMDAETARLRLRAFLAECRARGRRTVLVITGKGASPFARHTLHGHEHWHAPERAGRLRRLVPQWLHEHGFAHHVAGFQPAHPRHGGGGAFYIRLRRKDRGRAP